MEKKQYIMKVATNLFSKNGFRNTRMSDIAAACNISKATLYKFFPSKEELVMESFLEVGNEIAEEAMAVDMDETLSQREKFTKKLEATMRISVSRMEFYSLVRHYISKESFSKYEPEVMNRQSELVYGFRNMIIAAYDGDIENISWDITMCLMGILHEIMMLKKIDRKISYSDASSYVTDCLDGIVSSRKGKPPLVDEAYLQAHMHRHHKHDVSASLNQIKQQAEGMDSTDREKVLAATAMLEQHLNKGNAEWIVVEGMLAMLAGYPGMEESVNQLRCAVEFN